MQRKHSLRLVTLRDSRIKFGIGATRHGYIFRQGGPAMPRKAHAEYSFVLSRSKGRATDFDGACLRNERLNQIKRCGFWKRKMRTRTVHSSVYKMRENSGANSFSEKDEDFTINRRSEKLYKKKANSFRITNRNVFMRFLHFMQREICDVALSASLLLLFFFL